jgi:TonB family protein
MLDLLRSTRTASPLASAPSAFVSAFVSAAVHGVLLVALLAGWEVGSDAMDRWDRVVERLTYVAPPDIVSSERRADVHYDVGGTVGDGAGTAVEAAAEAGSARGAAVSSGASQAIPVDESVPSPAADPFADAFSIVEVEEIAERDPASAAPAYPPQLLEQGVEGYATLRFVVDSSGRVDLLSVRVVDSTHAAFVSAVRTAMPGMLFRPARRGDRPVRQLSEQQFKFQILPKQTARAP